jgi:basic amino acid/polyamine antiporter, APA family
MANLWAKKSLTTILAQAADSEQGLKRTLGAWNLIALGIGAIIGAGLFVRTASAASQAAGSAVTLSFIVAAIGCAFAGLCYAEFAASVPISGSAYAYAYVTMGELAAWIIGWALVMEYALGAATVSIAWSEYLNKLLKGAIPFEWCHSPMELSATGVRGIMNVPALFILFLLTNLLIRGTDKSATVNAIIVALKVGIVLIFIAVGWQFIEPANHIPYMIQEGTKPILNADGSTLVSYDGFFKHGYGGILGGAAIVFFAFIGFDAVSTTAQEAKNPARDMPIGIMGSLAVCTVLYILFAHVLTGVAHWSEFADPAKGREASVAYAISAHMPGYEWLATAVTVAILAGFSSVILVMLLGQSRVCFSMANDGLLPKVFSEIHPEYRTPFKSNWIVFAFVATFAAFIPGHLAGDLTSFGTLLAFVLVCFGILIMRKSNPDMVRPFKTPIPWLVAPLGALICTGMIVALDQFTLYAAFAWMALGLVVYFAYSQHHSKLNDEK